MDIEHQNLQEFLFKHLPEGSEYSLQFKVGLAEWQFFDYWLFCTRKEIEIHFQNYKNSKDALRIVKVCRYLSKEGKLLVHYPVKTWFLNP